MHPGINGKKFPDKPALIMNGSGKVVTHGELNDLSNQGAQLFRSLGLVPGDSIAIMLENHFLFFPIVFAAWRSGLRYTAISWRLQPDEVEYIVRDCEAKVFITSKFLEETALNLDSSLKTFTNICLMAQLILISLMRNQLPCSQDAISDECRRAYALLFSDNRST